MLETGIKGKNEEMVTPEKTARAISSGEVEVYATPMMILLMENTSAGSVKPFLEIGTTTVGSIINVSHVSATPVGMKIICESELIKIDGRRLVFSVKAYDEKGLIGEGSHERFIVNTDKFMTRANAKLS